MPRTLSLALVALWFLLIAIFLELSPFQSPWPQQRYRLEGAEFAALSGGQIDAGELFVEREDENHGALLVRSVDMADAAEWPVLRYRFEALAPTLEVAFLYRRADSPSDVRTVALTRSRGDTGTLDLSREADWRGAITEIGFAVYPVAQSVPAEHAFRGFRLNSAEFWSPSWGGRAAAVATEWSGRRAWSLMSISALGPDSGAARARSPVLLLTLGLVLTGLLLWQFAPGSGVRRLRPLAAGLVVAWLLLDLHWGLSLADRHAATRQVYASVDWPERQRRVADTDVLAAAQQVRQALRDDGADPDRVRLLVDAESDFLRARLIYHLAPTRTAPINLTGWPPLTARREPMYLALLQVESLTFDAKTGRLHIGDEASLPARPLIEAPPLRLYFLEGAVP
ncbi:MAG: hypothetical protein JNN30_12185 [Rhodanobacteraceae bacterium]|nr:hypothetical protein [Rhodanobacteraceae bacterium]